ncbi:hypothetical protein M378DRAFT_644780 [Amanita muscaria Koide BX008]|uniref:Uncharacterized protein n=1 Tax=Amanita muscaria (strain Koide BX008) TaxID=946122 RepID=A0A0C2SMQ2_AMAMK|nr:hypothetical protein M378DRAFT_644780 [Amanita muscaria Koide BX008]
MMGTANTTQIAGASAVAAGARAGLTMLSPGCSTSSSTTPTGSEALDSVKASYLLTRVCSLPCSMAAQTFTHLVQPMARFQLALDALLRLLAGSVEDEKNVGGRVLFSSQFPQRILLYVSFIPYVCAPITGNQFKSILLVSVVRGRDRAAFVVDKSDELVWVREIVMISVLLLQAHRQALPPTLRASHVILGTTSCLIYTKLFPYFQSGD